MVKKCEKRLPARIEELNNVLAFAEEALESAGCPLKEQMSISVCLEEMFVNIAQYAFPEGTEGIANLTLEVDEDAGEVRLSLSDNGLPFDPLKKADPDITLSAEERSIGGLGILMVKKMMDDVSYEYIDGFNVLTFTKRF